MIDRNKVIEAFERCFCEKHSSCPGCYQDGPGFGMECRKALLMDVLALLKEQEPAKPTLKRRGSNLYWSWYGCPECDEDLIYGQKYCSECGRKMSWDAYEEE